MRDSDGAEGFGVRDWVSALLGLAAVLTGAIMVLGVTYWLFQSR